MLLSFASLASGLGGCSMSTAEASPGAAQKTQPLWIGGKGASAVFRSPRASAELMGAPDEAMPEFYRRDEQLGGTPGPLLATSQWPQPEAPSVDYPRYVWLPRDASTYQYFQRPSEAYGRYRGDRYGWNR